MIVPVPVCVAAVFLAAGGEVPPAPLPTLRALSNPSSYTMANAFKAAGVMFWSWESLLLRRLGEFRPNPHGKLRDMEDVTWLLARYHSPRVIRALIAKLDVIYFEPRNPLIDGPGYFATNGEWEQIRPVVGALAKIGNPAAVAFVEAFLQIANDPAKDGACIDIMIALSDAGFMAKALAEAKKRLFAKPDDTANVRACKKLIRYLALNDRHDEIRDFADKFPPPWWDKFKE